MMRNILSIFCLGLVFASFETSAAKLNAGTWRFEMRSQYASIPFLIDFKWRKDELTGVLHNGKETIQLTGITVKKDHISIPLQTYSNTLELDLESPIFLKGAHVRQNKNPKVETPVGGSFNQKERFPGDKAPPTIDLNGRWRVSMTDMDGHITHGVLVFDQKKNALNGSLLTPTGDYRYFEGFVSGNEFTAASFDGSYNYMISGSVTKDILSATIGSSEKVKIEGEKDAKAELPDAYGQTKIDALDFWLPTPTGAYVSLKHKKFKNKPVIVQIFGSWCPNCMDEMNYLIPWYNKNHKRGVEIVALAFERQQDEASAKVQVMKVQKMKKVPYTIVMAGATSEDKPMDKIKGLKNFISFPTTIFLNRKHEVVKVHAGFTGPGTGEFFETWKKEFNQNVNQLLKK
jgi:thiol-disulfide isomerase/thioredoxin